MAGHAGCVWKSSLAPATTLTPGIKTNSVMASEVGMGYCIMPQGRTNGCDDRQVAGHHNLLYR
eukprot:1157259-Pelagomonas_calceolata.AAC.1